MIPAGRALFQKCPRPLLRVIQRKQTFKVVPLNAPNRCLEALRRTTAHQPGGMLKRSARKRCIPSRSRFGRFCQV